MAPDEQISDQEKVNFIKYSKIMEIETYNFTVLFIAVFKRVFQFHSVFGSSHLEISLDSDKWEGSDRCFAI